MNNLTTETKLTLDSREVTKMVGKRHSDLLRDIETYIGYIDQNADLRSDDFFKESSYKAGTGKKYKCYKITKKGCEFIANKLTGRKGTEFTATYINKFHEMKGELQPKTELQVLRMAIDQIEIAQQEAREAKQIAQNIKDAVIHTDEDWRNWINKELNKIAFRTTGNYQEVRNQSYRLLENKGRCLLEIRLNNLKDRLREAGATKTEISKANKLDVIEADTRLKEIYSSIVEKMVIKYSA
ncbi:MAG: Rha family transcriptional regulator [Firmicutes bacterium]|nr:Rha family transcriptional regulator [Bacillota bacterium]